MGYYYPTNIEGNRPFCYAINANGVSVANWGLVKTTPLDADTISRRPNEIRTPSDMIAIGDDTNGTTNNASYGWVKLTGWGVFTPGIFSRGFPGRAGAIGTVHSEGANMAFLDGHVEWARWWKWIEFSDAAARRWNYDNQPHQEKWGGNERGFETVFVDCGRAWNFHGALVFGRNVPPRSGEARTMGTWL